MARASADFEWSVFITSWMNSCAMCALPFEGQDTHSAAVRIRALESRCPHSCAVSRVVPYALRWLP
eukprot:324837-Chlamydomonas_euryale.AAC.1